jgi:hypothetical protein
LVLRSPDRYQSYGWVGLGCWTHPSRCTFCFGLPSAIHHLMSESQCTGLGIGLSLYISHKAPSHQDPMAIGVGGDYGMSSMTSQQVPEAGPTDSSSPHVSPTNTVAQCAAFADPFPTPLPGVIHVMHTSHLHWDKPKAPHALHRCHPFPHQPQPAPTHQPWHLRIDPLASRATRRLQL